MSVRIYDGTGPRVNNANSNDTAVRPPAIADPSRMDLTVEESEQAWAIRRAIEAIPEVDNLSDFMYCQLAIIVGDNVEDAVNRAKHLQSFREEYSILDNEPDGRRRLKGLLELLRSFEPRQQLTTPTKEGDWFAGYFYLQHALSPDFETLRQGVIFHCECNGYDWKKHFDTKLFRRLWDAYHASYPQRIVAKHYHTGVMFNILYAFVKKVYSGEALAEFQVGCQAPTYLDEIYLQPTPEIARLRTLMQLENSLRLRYKNEREFSLEAFTASLPPDEDEEGDY